MKRLEIEEMEAAIGAGGSNCGKMTGIFCGLTAILIFSTVFAPLAGATGPGCALGLAAGCGGK